jgi:hypothetical protein
MAYNRRDDDLAYGEYHEHDRDGAEGDRGFVGDMGRRLFGGRKEVRPLRGSSQTVFETPVLSLYTLHTLHMVELVRGESMLL